MYVVLVEIVLPQVDWEIMPKQMNILWKYDIHFVVVIMEGRDPFKNFMRWRQFMLFPYPFRGGLICSMPNAIIFKKEWRVKQILA